VCDASKGIRAAIRDVLPDVPLVSCHYHFLRDVGTDLLQESHNRLTDLLNGDHAKARIRKFTKPTGDDWAKRVAHVATLTLKNPAGAAFPFRVPSLLLYDRIQEAHAWTLRMLAWGAAHNTRLPAVCEFHETLERYVHDPDEPTDPARELRQTASPLRPRAGVFHQLRQALRLDADAQGPETLTRTAFDRALSSIQDEAKGLSGAPGTRGTRLVHDAKRHAPDLFAPVLHDGEPLPFRRTIVQVEQAHRAWKRGVRRRTGRSSVRKELLYNGVGLALVENWRRPAFRSQVGGLPGLVRVFRTQDAGALEHASTGLGKLRAPCLRSLPDAFPLPPASPRQDAVA